MSMEYFIQRSRPLEMAQIAEVSAILDFPPRGFEPSEI